MFLSILSRPPWGHLEPFLGLFAPLWLPHSLTRVAPEGFWWHRWDECSMFANQGKLGEGLNLLSIPGGDRAGPFERLT
jgi:hypothetical protein